MCRRRTIAMLAVLTCGMLACSHANDSSAVVSDGGTPATSVTAEQPRSTSGGQTSVEVTTSSASGTTSTPSVVSGSTPTTSRLRTSSTVSVPLVCTSVGSPDSVLAEIPDQVRRTRDQIRVAAVECDAPRLTELAGPRFRSSFGGDMGDPVPYWVETGFDVGWIVRLLATRPKLETFRDSDGVRVIDEYFVWPAAASSTATARDWTEAEALYPADVLATWRNAGGYFGFRLMIRPDGQWWGLLAGD